MISQFNYFSMIAGLSVGVGSAFLIATFDIEPVFKYFLGVVAGTGSIVLANAMFPFHKFIYDDEIKRAKNEL